MENVSFVDLDLDFWDLGGDLEWSEPLDSRQVERYNIYLAHLPDSYSDLRNYTIRSLLGNISVGEAALRVPPETSRVHNDSEAYSHFFIYTESSLVEQSTPRSHLIFDAQATVSDVELVDEDLDLEELGGDISWSPPADASRVALYRAFLASDATGGGRSQIGEDIWAPLTQTNLSAEQPLVSFSHLLVYTASQLVEQSTPNASAISDTVRVVSNIQFDDYDLDALQVGGSVHWSVPVPSSYVVSYRLAFGTLRNESFEDYSDNQSVYALVENEITSRYAWTLGQSLASTRQNVTQIPAETQLGDATHLLVFASSSLAEQQTPRAQLIRDTVSKASGVYFRDFDLDPGDLGGDISWLEPLDTRLVMQYVVYLATSAGADRSQISAVALGTNTLNVPPETKSEGRDQILVYTQSLLAEQSTPATFALSDLVAMVSNVSFEDFDLDATDLGGNLTWALAGNEALVTHYVVYLAQSCNGSNVSETLAALLSGSLVFSVDGATVSQVEAAVIAALAIEFGAFPDNIDVAVSSATTRRLTGEARRLAANTWLVTYQVLLTSMTSAYEAQSAVSGPSFRVQLGSQLIAQGVESSAVSSLVLIDFSSVSLSTVLVNSLPTLLPWSGVFNGSNMSFRYLSDEDSDGDFRRLSSASWESDQSWTYLCNLEYFGNVSVGVGGILVPAETALENFTHFAIFSRSAVVLLLWCWPKPRWRHPCASKMPRPACHRWIFLTWRRSAEASPGLNQRVWEVIVWRNIASTSPAPWLRL